jgi:GNAT superfamily N-acetyltransferase
MVQSLGRAGVSYLPAIVVLPPPAEYEPSSRWAGDTAAQRVGELSTVNQIVAHAIQTWRLPARVERLALPSLLYTTHDLAHMNVALSKQDHRTGIAVATWEQADRRDSPRGASAVLLHGLFVLQRWQGHSVGSRLLDFVTHWAKVRHLDGISLRTWREAEGFFRTRGFDPLNDDQSSRELHPRRLWKAL